MPAPPPIVVPTDRSPAAQEACAYAGRLAEALGAPVVRVRVEPQGAGAHESEGAPEGERDVPVIVRAGAAPAPEIVSAATEVGAGLLVLGTRERPGRLGLGGVASEVLHTAPCDVLLVPHRADQPFSARPVRRVLVPVDFSAASSRLVAFAGRLARDLGAAHLDLVHVLEPLPHPVRWIDETLVDLVPGIRQRAAEALRGLAVGLPPALDVGVAVVTGKAAATLARLADERAADLVVVGPHAERPVFDSLLGSVAEGVARRVRRPVLVARTSAAPGPDDRPPVDARSYEPEAARASGTADAG